MPFITRDGGGAIIALSARPQEANAEFLPDNDPAIVAFRRWGGRDLAAARAVALAEIDRQAEAERQQLIAPGSGLALVYDLKRRRAEEVTTNHDAQNPPAPGAFPLLEAEVPATAADVLGVATAILAKAAALEVAATAIEAVRMPAKAAIAAAADIAAIENALDGLVWPVLA